MDVAGTNCIEKNLQLRHLGPLVNLLLAVERLAQLVFVLVIIAAFVEERLQCITKLSRVPPCLPQFSAIAGVNGERQWKARKILALQLPGD